jgi:hypothetical protein
MTSDQRSGASPTRRGKQASHPRLPLRCYGSQSRPHITTPSLPRYLLTPDSHILNTPLIPTPLSHLTPSTLSILDPNMPPTGFPSLTPAFTVRVAIDPPMPVGGQAGSQLVIVPMVSGTVRSEEGFEPGLEGEL